MNQHSTYIKHFLNNKYTKWYFSIIEKSLNRLPIDGYYENHHILPKSIYPEFKSEKWNLVRLTSREHFICHILLTKMVENEFKIKMIHAAHRFSTSQCKLNDKKFKVSSRTYGILKELKSKAQSEFMKKNNPMKNPEYRKKCSQPGNKNGMFGKSGVNKGKTGELSHMFGVKRPDHSEKMKGNKHFPQHRVICPHCGKESNYGNYKRWHGDNCSTLQRVEE